MSKFGWDSDDEVEIVEAAAGDAIPPEEDDGEETKAEG